MDNADMCEFPFILPFVSLAAYHIGLEKIEGRWEWTRDSTVVFDPSLWNANEPNGQSVSPPELCGAFLGDQISMECLVLLMSRAASLFTLYVNCELFLNNQMKIN